MTGDERDLVEVLERTRRAWSPGEADAGRVRRALTATLAASPTSGENSASGPAGAPAPTSTSTWTSRLLVAGAIAAASGGAGYWAGHRVGMRDARPTTSLPALEPPKLARPEPTSARMPAPVSETPPAAMPSLVPAHHGVHTPRRGSESQTPPQTESLAIEVRALRNAERALRDGNPGLALAFLQELDRQVPNGQLAEERDAADTLARCARGDHPFGVNLAAEFTDRHPGSVYRARVEQACTETDSLGSGDSSPRRSER